MKQCGIDEVGRGALAGPLVGCGVAASSQSLKIIENSGLVIRDSKKMSPSQRQRVVENLSDFKIIYLIKSVSVNLINKKGIGWANVYLFEQIILQMEAQSYLCDGNLKLGRLKNKTVLSLSHADREYTLVSLASIIAKEYRDSLMKKLHSHYPQYHWSTNMGYGTKKHILALAQSGASRHHRRIFVSKFVTNHS